MKLTTEQTQRILKALTSLKSNTSKDYDIFDFIRKELAKPRLYIINGGKKNER